MMLLYDKSSEHVNRVEKLFMQTQIISEQDKNEHVS